MPAMRRSKSIRATGRSLKVKEPIDLPALNVNLAYRFDFADPIFRLGNDYSKGIILSTGYVGQRTTNNLVTCLTDGHPGVSGGGVLNRDWRARRHSDRPDAGRLPLLVHPSAAAGDVPEDPAPEQLAGKAGSLTPRGRRRDARGF